MCLTETKQKVERFQCNEKLVKHETMRDERDGKEGGGLQIWARKCDEINMKRIENKENDLLEL